MHGKESLNKAEAMCIFDDRSLGNSTWPIIEEPCARSECICHRSSAASYRWERAAPSAFWKNRIIRLLSKRLRTMIL